MELNNLWTPCSKASPTLGTEVLLTFKNDSGLQVDTAIFLGDAFYYIIDTPECSYEDKYRQPIAWMPIPEPYNGSVL